MLRLRARREELVKVVERGLARDDARAAQRRVGVERGGDDVDDREERPDTGEDADRVAPPVRAELTLAPPARDAACDRNVDRAVDGTHARFSSDFVRLNDTAEIVATMKKITIDSALARP